MEKHFEINHMLNAILLSEMKKIKSGWILVISNTFNQLSYKRGFGKYAHVILHEKMRSLPIKQTDKKRALLISGDSEQVITQLRRKSLPVSHIKHCIVDYDETAPIIRQKANLQFILSKFKEIPPTTLVIKNIDLTPEIKKEFMKSQFTKNINIKEHAIMDGKNHKYVLKDKRNSEAIKALVRKMVLDTDAHELDAYRKLVRRNVSIFRRSYLAGYLFQMVQSGSGDSRSRQVGQQRKVTRNQARFEPSKGSKEQTVCLHFSCGSIHGLNEQALKELIESTVSSEAMQAITRMRVYDRYVFVYIDTNYADNVIRALNGTKNFNRKIVVGYSHRNTKDNPRVGVR